MSPEIQGDFFETFDDIKTRNDLLNELINRTNLFQTTKDYFEIIKFLSKFTQYSIFNCVLLFIQNPKASLVATARQWKTKFGRSIKEGERPMLILAPGRPVLFVFDLVSTEGPSLPNLIKNPFAVRGHLSEYIINRFFNRARREGVNISFSNEMRSLRGGEAFRLEEPQPFPYVENYTQKEMMQYFGVNINADLPLQERFPVLVHELGHIFSGHLGICPEAWWGSRLNIGKFAREMEAESINYIVCQRLGLETQSDKYLALKAQENITMPDISFDVIVKVSSHIEKMIKD